MTRKKSDDAVSPVIGVMLMLVVVIIVAAVVTTFATGMTDNVEAAPIAQLDVEIISDQKIYGYQTDTENVLFGTAGTIPTLHLTHVSGDPLDTADLKLTFTWECNGHGRHTSTYQAGTGAMDNVKDVWAPSGYGATMEPLYVNYGAMNGAYFGNHVLKRGETMVAFDLHYNVGDGAENLGSPVMDALFNNGNIQSTLNPTQYGDEYEKLVAGCAELYQTQYCELHPDTELDASIYGVDGEYDRTKVLFTCPVPDCDYSYPCPICGGEITSLPYVYTYDDDSGDLIKKEVAPNDDSNSFDAAEFHCANCGNIEPIYEYTRDVTGGEYSAGIMECLPEGTAVNVMITHIPSNTIIYDEKVFVE